MYLPSENPESPAASRSKSFSSDDAMVLVPNDNDVKDNTESLF